MGDTDSGIYCIRNLRDGKRYIGSAHNFSMRWARHRKELRQAAREAAAGQPERTIHNNLHLQRAWVKYGESAFIFEVLETCPVDKLFEREQHYLDTQAGLYNIATDAFHPSRGRKRSPETIDKQAAALRGRTPTLEHRAALSAARMGYKPSLEARAKMSAAAKRRKVSAETRAKFSAGQRARYAREDAPMRGRKQSTEHIAKRVAIVAAKTRGRKLSPEHRANISASHLGQKRSAQMRTNMSAASSAKKGKYPISESRRAALRAYYASEEGRAAIRERARAGAAARWGQRHTETSGDGHPPSPLDRQEQ